jgi:hypothetical protein
MSITFSADIDFTTLPRKQVRLVDQYDGLDNADFASDGYTQDAEGYYVTTEIDVDYTYERNFANANFYSIMGAIDHNLMVSARADGGCGSLDAAHVSPFLAKVIKARNSAKLGQHERETVQEGNMIHCGINREYIETALTHIMEVCQTAIKANVGVYWG